MIVWNWSRSVSDSKWRTQDSRAVFQARSALSSMHHGVLSDLLTERVGVDWDARTRRHSDGPRFEITGIPEPLLSEFSTSADHIDKAKDDLIDRFVADHGRRPTGVEIIRLRQQATLSTWPAKTHRSLAEMTAAWHHQAAPHLAPGHGAERQAVEGWVASWRDRNALPLLRAGDLDESMLGDAAAVVVSTVADKRATFRRDNLVDETHRLLAGVRFATPEARIAVAERVTDLAVGRSLNLTPPELVHTPDRYLRPDGTSRLRPQSRRLYTTRGVLDAASEVLAGELQTETENTAKWLTEHHRQPARTRHRGQLSTALAAYPYPGSATAARLGDRLDQLDSDLRRWQLRKGQLLIIDEASLASTTTLDQLATAATEADAKILLVGDWAQLSAVDAGGAFGLLAHDPAASVVELGTVRRFTNDWERAASIDLRNGHERAFDAYQTHGRITGGARDQLLDQLYTAWKTDTDAGHTSLMIAADTTTVNDLNQRAQADHITGGQVSQDGVTVGPVTVGVGDIVVTRRNDRRLTTGAGWVKNGDRWTVTAITTDGTLTVQRAGGHSTATLPARLCQPAPRARICHHRTPFAGPHRRHRPRPHQRHHQPRSPLRGRHPRTPQQRPLPRHQLRPRTRHQPRPPTTEDARRVFTAVLANRGAELSAHETLRQAQRDAESWATLHAEYQTLVQVAQADRWDTLLARSGLTTAQHESVSTSPALGSLHAALRNAEAHGIDIETTLPLVVTARPLQTAEDMAAVIGERVERLTHATSTSRRDPAADLIAGLVPRARNIADPDLNRALHERDHALQSWAFDLARDAITNRAPWLNRLGRPAANPNAQRRWVQAVATIAAYRDRWNITDDQQPLGNQPPATTEQAQQRTRATHAAQQAIRISQASRPQPTQPVLEAGIAGPGHDRGVDP